MSPPSPPPGPTTSGAHLLVEALRTHGADTIFCVPGESYLATLDALYEVQDQLRLVVCRQEGSAAYMADAYGKLTGRPGLCFVTRGPGACNAAIGIHTAHQDSTPLILFVGQIARSMADREAFQEIDYRRMFGPLCKWVAQIDSAARIPELVSRAFHTALSGRPGPVVLALPVDVQTECAAGSSLAPYRVVHAHPGAADLAAVAERLHTAQRPLLLLGGSPWTPQACADMAAFAEAYQLPTATTFRRQDLFDNRHPCYAGVVGFGLSPTLAQRIRQADLLLVVGAQLGEVVTQGYQLLDLPRPRQQLIHITAGVAELGKVYQTDLPINAAPEPFAAAARTWAPPSVLPWGRQAREAHAEYEAFRGAPAPTGQVDLAQVVRWLDAQLPEDAIVTNGAGNYASWVHRFYRYKGFPTQLAPQSGAMGYGVPAGVAAGLLYPGRVVVSFSGDGCFLMNGQELATAVRYGAQTVFLVVNNGRLGTIRMHQERTYPGRVIGTDLTNPDFAALARAYGAYGEAVTDTEAFPAAFARAQAAPGPALLELHTDPEVLSPGPPASRP